MSDENIMVTGGAGFIGSHIVHSLLKRGDHVICIDNFNNYYNPKIKEKNVEEFIDNKNFELFRLDIRDFNSMKQLFTAQKIDKIIHLAGMVGVRNSFKNPQIYKEVNIDGTSQLLELSKDHNIKEFIFASTSSVYGDNCNIPFSEDDTNIRPISPYGMTKYSAENLCKKFHHIHNIPITCFRFFTVYGPRVRPDMAVYKFTKLINEGKEIPVFGYGNMKRNFTYVSDIVDGVISALDKNLNFEIINLGGDKTICLEKFISLLEDYLGKTVKKNLLPMQQGDMKVTIADCSKAKKILNYNPKVTIEQGLKIFIKWFEENQYELKTSTYI